jgi:primosomal protein N''
VSAVPSLRLANKSNNEERKIPQLFANNHKSFTYCVQQYNAQFTAIAKLDKKQQVIENRTLKLLAGKLLPLIDFSVEKELEKFQAVQP